MTTGPASHQANEEYRHHFHAARLSKETESRALAAATHLKDWSAAVREIVCWPEYAPQPLWMLERTAARLGLGQIYYKDESQRFGVELGSFKALGAPYAVSVLLAKEVETRKGVLPSTWQLRNGEFRSITERVTVCVATDGNQGRGLAYAAHVFGCRCVTYIHRHVSEGRKEAMERYGAIVIRVDGEYEDSVRRAREDARMNGWHFVSSTSWDDFSSPIPRSVMNAYMVMVEEALAQIPALEAVTHVFVQGGVGSIAAAIFLGFAQRCGEKLPRFVVVEPEEADCLYATAVNGRPTPSRGSLKTLQAGLACREVSPAAWAVLDWLASDFVTIPDSWAVEAMRALAEGGGDVPVVCGESAAGGMGVLLQAAKHPQLREKLGLMAESQVVLFGCEGATDPALYQELTGQAAEDVFAAQREAAGDLG